jgi:ribosomal protein S27AE
VARRPTEHSDDLKRGTLPHLRTMMDRLTAELRGAKCSRCGSAATHLIDTHRPRPSCSRCKEAWRALSPFDRSKARHDFQVRGRW